MKYLRLFEDYYKNPYNPDEIWENEVELSLIGDSDEMKKYLDSLVGKTIIFNGDVGPTKLLEYELVKYQDAHLIDLEDDVTFMDVYFITEDGEHEVSPYQKIKVVE